MEQCKIELNNGIAKCSVCGWSIQTKETEAWRVRRECRPVIKKEHNPKKKQKKIKVKFEKPEPPPLTTRLKNFSKSAIEHALKGSPTCTQEQIDARLAICKECPLYRPSDNNPDVGVCTHETCGCNLNKERIYLNKLAWADQACPIKKWGAEI